MVQVKINILYSDTFMLCFFFFFRLKEQQDLSMNEEEIDKCSHNVEGEMFSFFGDTGHRYKNKYRSLMFNLKDPRNKVGKMNEVCIWAA